jgi:hypothetical protein
MLVTFELRRGFWRLNQKGPLKKSAYALGHGRRRRATMRRQHAGPHRHEETSSRLAVGTGCWQPGESAETEAIGLRIVEVIGRTPGGYEIAAWILKGDPNVFDLDAALEDEGVIDSWSVHKTYRTGLLAEGQRCYLWRSGPDAAIVASGYVTGPVESRQAIAENWVDRDKAKTATLFVPVELYQLGEEITRNELKADPILSRIEILKMPQGSNPSILKPEEFRVLESLVAAIEERDAPAALVTTAEAIREVYPNESGGGSTLYGLDGDEEEFTPALFEDEMEALLAGVGSLADQIGKLPIVDPLNLDSEVVPIVQVKNNRADYVEIYKVLGGFRVLQFGEDDAVEVGDLYSELTTLIQAIYNDELGDH